MSGFVDLAGQRFGRWTVIERTDNKSRHTRFLCVCDCGTIKKVPAIILKNGTSKSCGCYRRDLKSVKNRGYDRTRLYKAWGHLKSRCYNEKDINYPNYGGRGITVCKEWENNFQSFMDWSLANGYTDELSIDRIDVNGNYEPDNCRWTDWETQCNNRRSNIYITYKGKTQTLKQWCDELELDYKLLQNRITYLGWSFEEAISKPKKPQRKKVYCFYNGEYVRLSDLSRKLGISRFKCLKRYGGYEECQIPN